MSDKDAERKAKAARAKKLLAQRQKEKAKAAASITSSNATPSSPLSTVGDGMIPSVRTSLSLDDTAGPKVETGTETVSPDLDKDAGKATPNDVPPVTSPDSLANLQQTVSLLIAERTDLQNRATGLQTSLNSSKADSQLLAEGRTLIARLEEEKSALETQLEKEKGTSREVVGLEESVTRLKKELGQLRGERDKLQRESKEHTSIREQDRKRDQEKIDELAKVVDRARERESGLETEVGRLRQSNTESTTDLTTAKARLDQLRSSSSADSSSLSDLQKTHEELQSSHSTLQTRHDQLVSTHTALQATHSTLQSTYDTLKSEHGASSSTHRDLTNGLTEAKKKVEEVRKQVDAANKRADGVENKRQALQDENAELVKQLEEVRGRVVEVMEEKVLLAASAESWETKGKAWEKQRIELKGESEQVKSLRDRLEFLGEENGSLKEIALSHEQLKKHYAELVKSPSDPDSMSAAHSLEISQHAERVRTLEKYLHTSTSRVHSLSRQLTELQTAYAAAVKDNDQNGFSPRASSSRGLFLSPDEDSIKSPPLPPSRPIGVDALLPASVRHKRQVSLSALKARMQPSYARPPHSPTKIESVVEGEEPKDESRKGSTPSLRALGLRGAVRKQFGDEIVFCCPACEGDLVTL